MTENESKLLHTLAHPGKKWAEFPTDEYNYPRSPNHTFTTFAEIEPVMQGLIREELWDDFLKYSSLALSLIAKGQPVHVDDIITDITYILFRDNSGKLRFFDLVVKCPAVQEHFKESEND